MLINEIRLPSANLYAQILYSPLKDNLHVVCWFWTDPYHPESTTDSALGPVQLSSSCRSILFFQPFELSRENNSVQTQQAWNLIQFQKTYICCSLWSFLLIAKDFLLSLSVVPWRQSFKATQTPHFVNLFSYLHGERQETHNY